MNQTTIIIIILGSIFLASTLYIMNYKKKSNHEKDLQQGTSINKKAT